MPIVIFGKEVKPRDLIEKPMEMGFGIERGDPFGADAFPLAYLLGSALVSFERFQMCRISHRFCRCDLALIW